jgi:plastocyanin
MASPSLRTSLAIFAILALVLVVGVAVFVISRDDSPTAAIQESPVTQTQSPSAAKHTIEITKEGFSPKNISVTLGDEVIFINTTSSSAWPASDFHPSHDIYPAFDPGQGIQSGDSWSFVFDRVGKWNFHDHLLPARRGVITVE